MLFTLFITIIILQRAFELVAAKNNERWMKERGALEFGKRHYQWIVLIHALFFVSYIFEVLFFEKGLSRLWPMLFFLFILTQAGRLWALFSLGRFWNTKIIVMPGANVIRRGPYQFIKHPNYMIVAAEFVIIPLMFQAYITAIVFTLLNILIMSIRIPAEEKALRELTKYEDAFMRLKPEPDKDIKKV
ncbi:hypothetical protein J7I93_18125 [Bacillus sp. ISL-47]|uniref:isoprenylcysteine carboxyl methyltransferase family protein n=1 Tax=Bacillus sp. ISL-47 TaxID=2819130 RepID=UPI001BE88BEC|nr:isoprenylcysteine carboxylmethyltransferase family protein [Bacillus sp. ISL-47]MBT2690088.1 hypothetical protein [Bacillus sp. ISL-47]MBT2707884.1 hypothetical protein [Pseudomonas sp. ISL-84]